MSVPLYTLAVKGISLPIALAYHSTGLLVDERAGNAGLGWNCTALSVIGHTVMGGLSDFGPNGYCRGSEMPPIPYAPYPIDPASTLQSYSDAVLRREVDNEPDVYSYSFPGHSGKFIFDRAGVAHCIPYAALKIEYASAQPGDDLTSFTITDEAGNVFHFGTGEFSATSAPAGCGPRDGVKALSGTTSYVLSQITTPYRDTVNFEYRSVTEMYHNQVDLSEYEVVLTQGDGGCNNIYPARNCVTQTQHTTSVLTKIVHRGEAVEFTYDEGRRDLVGGVALAGIKVKYNGVLRKQFALYHSYFGAAGTDSNPPLTAPAPADYWRLRLDSVRQIGLPAYRFAYWLPPSQSFPAVHSYGQDLWGYYNGRNDNATLVQRLVNHLGANRDSDSLAVKLGMLRRITYPTGGTTTFTYEANTAYRVQRLADELETLGAVLAISPNANERARADTTFTLVGTAQDRRRVSIYFVFPAPTTVNTGGNGSGELGPGGAGSGSSVSGGSAVLTLTDAATGTEYYRAVSGGAVRDNIAAPVVMALPGGATYRLSAQAVGGDANSNPGTDPNAGGLEYSGQLTVRAQRIIPGGEQVVGGCRIRQITSDGRTGFGTPGTTYYRYTDSLGVATGYVLNQPVLTSQVSYAHTQNGAQIDCTYNVYQQSSGNQALISGNVAAYTQVTVLNGPINGSVAHKSVYFYNAVYDDDTFSNRFPFPPPDSYDWLRGKLVREQDYRFTGGGYALAREKTYAYRANLNLAPIPDANAPVDPNQAVITGYRVYTYSTTTTTQQVSGEAGNLNAIIPYHYFSASVYLTKTRETLYGDQGQPFTTVKLFDYDDRNLAVKRERTVNSLGDTLAQFTYYHLDGSTIPPGTQNPNLLALRWQQSHHILDQPVETTRYRYRVGRPPLALQRTLTVRQLVHGIGVPLREYASQGGAGVAVPISYEALAADSLAYDGTYYPLVVHQRYDPQGHVLQQALPGGRPAAYLYGYDDQLLVAQATNAAWNQVAATSFEPDATGRWAYDSTGAHRVAGGRAGRWAYRLDGQGVVRRDRLPAGGYELTLWAQGGVPPAVAVDGATLGGAGLRAVATGAGGWTQFHATLTVGAAGQVSLDVPTGATALLVDDVRLAPVGAQLMTYTHDPLVGVTSQTGPDGRTVFYEYDGLNRLVRTRDERGHVLAEQQYHYAGQ